MKTISVMEYRRRVFNKCMLECFSRIHESCTGLDPKSEDYHECNLATMAKKMNDAFYNDLLKLDTSTIPTTKKNLAEAVTFIQDCMNISETIANDKADNASKGDLEIPDGQEIELSPEDNELIDKVFDEKSPDVQVDAIRDATVKALIAEDKKAQEIKDSLSIAQSQVAAGGDPKAMEETVSRLGNRGPTSLMNAIMNSMAAAAVKNVNENSTTPVSVGKVMSENADEIKTRSTMMYTLFEMASVFGIHKYNSAEVKRIAEEIYYNK